MTKLQILTREIAEHLGKSWRPITAEEGRRSKIVRKDGAEIWIRGEDSHGAGLSRLAISGLFPSNHLPWGTECPHITAAVSRGSEAIAGDIERRFLPKYLPLFEQNMKAKTADEKWERKKWAYTEAFIKALDGELAFDQTVRFKGPANCYGNIRVNGDTVDLRLTSLDLDTAIRLAEHLTSGF